MTPSTHSHDSDPSGNPFSKESTPDLAQAIRLMTQELHLRESSSIPTSRVKEPDTFDGSKPHKLNNFILLCNLYFRRNSAFSHDEDKVAFALSHLRGTALELFEPTILDSSEIPDWLYDWSAFLRTLRTHFGPVDPTADAENGIDNLKMSENQPILNYNVNFNRLAVRTGWHDSVLRHRYYSGLAERIKDIMGQQGKPSTLSEMKNLAHSIDSRHWERLREKSCSENSAPHSGNSRAHSATPPSSKHDSTSSDSSDKPRKPLNPISDKLGQDGKLTVQERQRRFDNNLCLFCGETGHMVKNCPRSIAKALAAQADDNSGPENPNSDSSGSENPDSDSRNSNSEDSDSGDSDPENPDYENSDSENSEPENSDPGNSEYHNPENSGFDNSESGNSDSEDSESDDSGSEDSE